CLQFKTFPYSF
nr:immunoglobulin light chain junction region [Macaca mulatta]MOV78000.1 immunoglobulin light chain junction region [Macaca mulatta]MOV78904.1 immunoglobulin light chain junction region [Macaca mulatta]MOV79068.1 immunoglobulin light chain junction region [Macaca mulatta]MOV79123.1 immunoglobulin light chain junction region [Macaca mulatta]